MTMAAGNASRRSLLTAALGAAAAAPLLAACSGGSSTANGGVSTTKGLAKVLPEYVPATGGVTPDIPSVNGVHGAITDPGYLKYPTDLVRSVTDKPGAGGTYTAITPLWGSIPPGGSDYYKAVNAALGANVTISPANGNSYNNTVPTLVAGNKLPDWIQLPTWWNSALNVGELAATKFADLTDFLSGSKIRKYPHLAAIPTGGWQAGAWAGRLYGIPSFTTGDGVPGALFFREDVFDAKGINPDDIKTADDLYHLGGQLTATKSNVWAFDVLWLMVQFMYKVPAGGYYIDHGKLRSSYDTPQMESALEYAYKLAKSGYVHPDALAGNNSSGGQRFYSGQCLVGAGGTGAWNAQDAQNGRAANDKYVRGAFKLFSYDGSTPSMMLAASTSIVSYLSKKLSKAQIEECLRIANYLAAPFGSAEYTLVNYGVRGVDWTRKSTGPHYTTKGQKEASQQTYQFLTSPQAVVSNPGYEYVTKAYTAWAADMVKYVYKPVFWGMNVTPPSRFSSISTAQEVTDTITQITYGKKTVADFKSAVKTWKAAGGNALIDWYDKNVLQKYGSGQD